MSLFSNKQPETPVDLDKLREEIEGAAPEHRNYAPPRERSHHTPLQVIGHAITRLTWKDAQAMGAGIQSRLAAEPATAAQNMAAAIQAWAEEWESFE